MVYNKNVKDITKVEKKPSFDFNGREYEATEEIAYFSQELYILKLENKLLGDFDSVGKYVLPEEVLKNLTDLKKTVTKKQDEDLYCKAECLNYEFKFVIKFIHPAKNKKVAQLFLVEAFKSNLENSKELLSLVANYYDDDDAFFEDKYKKIFNIVADDEDGKKEENENIAKAILEKLKFENRVYVNYLLQTRQKDKIYVEKLLKTLSLDPTATAALKKFELLLAKYQGKIKPGDKEYYRILKQLLDEVLEEQKKKLSNNLNLFIMGLRQSYLKSNTQLIETLKTKIVEKKKEIDKQIKLGKGFGSPKFSYYKGATSKKGSAEAKKYKHPNIESSKSEKTVDQTIKEINDLLAKQIGEAASGYLKRETFADQEKKKSVDEPLKKFLGNHTEAKTEKQEQKETKKPEEEHKKQQAKKQTRKEKEEEKESIFGNMLG